MYAIRSYYGSEKYSDIKVGTVKWPMSVIRISGRDKERLIQLAYEILEGWKAYSDPTANIFAFTEGENEGASDGNQKTPHNTITPIARTNKDGELELDLVLRNNLTSEEYPDGIYHPHKELHHIKKENIGLIEVMGLAVLPGRLDEEIKLIRDILTEETLYNKKELETDEALVITSYSIHYTKLYDSATK